jgi:hypothetical protein
MESAINAMLVYTQKPGLLRALTQVEDHARRQWYLFRYWRKQAAGAHAKENHHLGSMWDIRTSLAHRDFAATCRVRRAIKAELKLRG